MSKSNFKPTTFQFKNDTIAILTEQDEFTFSKNASNQTGPNIFVNFEHRILELERESEVDSGMKFTDLVREISCCFDGLIHQWVTYLKHSFASLGHLNPRYSSFLDRGFILTIQDVTTKEPSIQIDYLTLGIIVPQNGALIRDVWVNVLWGFRSCLVHRGKYILCEDMEKLNSLFPEANGNLSVVFPLFIEKLMRHLRDLFELIKESTSK